MDLQTSFFLAACDMCFKVVSEVLRIGFGLGCRGAILPLEPHF